MGDLQLKLKLQLKTIKNLALRNDIDSDQVEHILLQCPTFVNVKFVA